jgi:hypothetical protein
LHDGFPVTHIMWRARHISWVAEWLAARSDKQRQTLRFFGCGEAICRAVRAPLKNIS